MKTIKHILLLTLAFGFIASNCFAVELLGVDIHGFASQGYIQTTDNNFFGDTEDGSFQLNEFGINFGKDFFDRLHLGAQVLSRDFGSNGNNDISLDWGFADFRWKDWLGARAGRLKAPKGLYNETRDIDMLRATIFLPQSVYPEILREMDLSLDGGGLYGYIGLNRLGSFSYQAMYGTQDIDPNEAASQALQGTTAIETPMENDAIDVGTKYVASLVYNTPLDGLRVGGTYDSTEDTLSVTGHMTEGMMAGTVDVVEFDKYENMVYSAEYTIGNLIMAAEYIQNKKTYTHNMSGGSGMTGGGDGEGGGDGGGADSIDITSDGWYLSASYQFTDWFQLGSYYSESYNDMDDRDGDTISDTSSVYHRAYFKDICLTTAFTYNYSWSLKLEGHLFNGTYGVSPLDQVADENGDVFAEEDWGLFAAKLTYSF